jgi:hypothetical protein
LTDRGSLDINSIVLTGLHFLLTYRCVYECDHCFLYCGPQTEGTFTIAQIEEAIRQAVDTGINSIYVEGGEPFLYYPLMLETLRLAKRHGLSTGIITNCYWATSERDAELWLRPLVDIGIDDLSVSDDVFHVEDIQNSPAKLALQVAEKLGLPVGAICIEAPTALPKPMHGNDGAVIGGDVLLKGRAADKLAADLPRRPFECFDECPHEDLHTPERVHVDPFGNVFVCQGISIGCIWDKPLAALMSNYRPMDHPIVGPLLRGGPAELARQYNMATDDPYVDHCHLCFLVRRALAERFPEYLCPRQVYGA